MMSDEQPLPVEVADEWRCPQCGSPPDDHRVERDGPESLEVVVCQVCGAQWPPRATSPAAGGI